MSPRHTPLPDERPIPVHAERWRKALPAGAWPAGFAEGNTAFRADVFDVADRWRNGAASTVHLVTAALAWGHGIRGYGRYRTRQVLAQDPNGTRLDAALEALRTPKPSPDALLDAYDHFRSTHRLRGLGPAFFTKILYFAGYRHGRGGIQPLILDKVVAGRLPDEAGPANRYTTQWASSTWHAYLRWAAAEAARPEFGGRPELVEMSLFNGTWRC